MEVSVLCISPAIAEQWKSCLLFHDLHESCIASQEACYWQLQSINQFKIIPEKTFPTLDSKDIPLKFLQSNYDPFLCSDTSIPFLQSWGAIGHGKICCCYLFRLVGSSRFWVWISYSICFLSSFPLFNSLASS